jgi:hypothetical protein
MRICPAGVELFNAGGRTDIKLLVTFRNLANAPETDIRVQVPVCVCACVRVRLCVRARLI